MNAVTKMPQKETTLDLEVAEMNLGKLETNAEAIRDFVKGKLAGYSVEKYSGERIKEAKNDRSKLNAAAKKLNDRRIELERAFMKPFDPVKTLIDETVDLIKKASAKIDEVVKDVEQGEKDEKRRQIDLFWTEQKCDLFRLEQIFDERWTNKTTKLADVQAAIKERIAKVNGDLVILDKIGEPEARAYYLDCLDLNRAMAEADRIKANRERLAKIEKDRAEAEAKPAQPEPAAAPEYEEPSEEEYADSMPEDEAPAEFTVPAPPPLLEYRLRVTGTKPALQALLEYMDEHKIGHEQIKGT